MAVIWNLNGTVVKSWYGAVIGAELFPGLAVSLPDVGWADRSAAPHGRG